MNRQVAEKLLDALERVDHGGFGGPTGLTAKGKDRAALYDLAVRVRRGLLEDARDYLSPDRPADDVELLERAVSWLTSSVELGRLLSSVEGSS